LVNLDDKCRAVSMSALLFKSAVVPDEEGGEVRREGGGRREGGKKGRREGGKEGNGGERRGQEGKWRR
jgi:hypothetical protein